MSHRILRQLGVLTLLVVAVDLAAKTLATTAHEVPGVEPVDNPGLLLGISNPTSGTVLVLATTGLLVFGAVCVIRTLTGRLPVWVTGLLLGGAFGNLADRAVSGAVRDFIATPWVIFNLADIALLVGATAFLSLGLRQLRGAKPRLRAARSCRVGSTQC